MSKDNTHPTVRYTLRTNDREGTVQPYRSLKSTKIDPSIPVVFFFEAKKCSGITVCANIGREVSHDVFALIRFLSEAVCT